MNNLKATANGNLLEMFAGAVFALHQDTLLKYTIDMWLTDDRQLNDAWDRLRPSQLGEFPERLGLLIEALFAIENANHVNGTAPPPDVSVTPEFAATLLIATMRSRAARVWLMTILRISATARIKPGVEKNSHCLLWHYLTQGRWCICTTPRKIKDLATTQPVRHLTKAVPALTANRRRPDRRRS